MNVASWERERQGREQDLSPVKTHAKTTPPKDIKGRIIVLAHATVLQIPQFVVRLSEMSIFDRKFKHLLSTLLTNYYCLLKPCTTLADIFNLFATSAIETMFSVWFVCLSVITQKLPAQHPRAFERGCALRSCLTHAHPSSLL